MDSGPVGRRAFLAGLGAVAWSLSACTTGPSPEAPTACGRGAEPRWPGHRPCRVYLGMSSPDDIGEAVDRTGPLGVHRSYFDWNDLGREAAVIADDHAHRRLPWVSFKPASEAPGGWAEVASGGRDDDLRVRARLYARLEQPVVVTFHHEPSNDDTGSADEFAAAWTRVHDVLRNEARLTHVAVVPILGEWEYNPRNEAGDPDRWLTGGVLDRASFLGVDIYQNAGGETYPERLGRVLEWLDRRGYSRMMLGVGETGCTDTFGSPTALEWWRRSWNWVEEHVDRVGVVAYFNSSRNSKPDVYWPHDESEAKLEAFRDALDSQVACRLRPIG